MMLISVGAGERRPTALLPTKDRSDDGRTWTGSKGNGRMQDGEVWTIADTAGNGEDVSEC